MPRVDDFSLLKLSAHGGTEIIEVDRLQAITAEEVSPGVWIYDMGQNFAGVPEIDFDGLPRGTTVTMRFAEMTYPDLPEHKGRQRHLMVENIRAAMNRDIYIARGGRESFSPRGTCHGYVSSGHIHGCWGEYGYITGPAHALVALRAVGGYWAMNRDIYIARGGRESFSPRGTYHGYRYIEISGIDHALPLDFRILLRYV